MNTIKERLRAIDTEMPLADYYVEGMSEMQLFKAMYAAGENVSDWRHVDPLIARAIESKEAFLKEKAFYNLINAVLKEQRFYDSIELSIGTSASKQPIRDIGDLVGRNVGAIMDSPESVEENYFIKCRVIDVDMDVWHFEEKGEPIQFTVSLEPLEPLENLPVGLELEDFDCVPLDNIRRV